MITTFFSSTVPIAKCGPEQSNKIYHTSTLNTSLGVQRIIDDLINMLDFQSKSKIGVSDILSSFVSRLSESETESKKKKSVGTRPVFVAN